MGSYGCSCSRVVLARLFSCKIFTWKCLQVTCWHIPGGLIWKIVVVVVCWIVWILLGSFAHGLLAWRPYCCCWLWRPDSGSHSGADSPAGDLLVSPFHDCFLHVSEPAADMHHPSQPLWEPKNRHWPHPFKSLKMMHSGSHSCAGENSAQEFECIDVQQHVSAGLWPHLDAKERLHPRNVFILTFKQQRGAAVSTLFEVWFVFSGTWREGHSLSYRRPLLAVKFFL